MKSLLVLNILALSLPFLCFENDENCLHQKSVSMNRMLKGNSLYTPMYYPPKPAVLINNPFMPHPYAAKHVVVRLYPQILQWQVPLNIYPRPFAHNAYLPSSLIALPTQKVQDKESIPTIDTLATIEPTHIPNIEPKVNTVVTAEVSSDSSITNTPEPTAIPATSPIVPNH
ncbi:kappa-casein [Tenrec ecaudatus]|uniref:kappa-casein n=1 Tax=Tenrec ecaudatus TaxID=94439 RepID=UPI003F594EAB